MAYLNLKNGTRVSHRRMGVGTIVGQTDFTTYKVKFDNDSWNGPVYEWELFDENGDLFK